MDIKESIKKFVEEECKKPSSKYGYDAYLYHFVPVHDYALKMSENSDVDREVVELAAWLHDIGSIIFSRENHHITGAEIAENKLKELGFDKIKIEKIKRCILNHRGSTNFRRESKEEQIIADADVMSHFDDIPGLFRGALIDEKKNQIEAKESVRIHLINDWNKLSSEAKEIIKNKYEAAMLLLK